MNTLEGPGMKKRVTVSCHCVCVCVLCEADASGPGPEAAWCSFLTLLWVMSALTGGDLCSPGFTSATNFPACFATQSETRGGVGSLKNCCNELCIKCLTITIIKAKIDIKERKWVYLHYFPHFQAQIMGLCIFPFEKNIFHSCIQVTEKHCFHLQPEQTESTISPLQWVL